MAQTVLISGATGLIGKKLTNELLDRGYSVHILSRRKQSPQRGVESFLWDYEKDFIDAACFDNVSAVIHLAGESIAAKPWTNERKKRIIESRTRSLSLLRKGMEENGSATVHTLISASATGFYGDRGDELLTEESRPGDDFMAQTCIEWEHAADAWKKSGIRVVKLRTGIVLSSEGGALPVIAKPVKAGFGAVLGSGRQWLPWIHIDDVVRMYVYALETSEMEGAFNQTAPSPVTNRQLTEKIAAVLKKPLWLPAVPSFMLRVIMGEMKAVVLNSARTSPEKIKDAGFKFNFEDAEAALNDIYGKTNR